MVDTSFSAGVGKHWLADWACEACPSPTVNALRTNLICPPAFPLGNYGRKAEFILC
ncbi:hypothetical protein B4119_3558 [Parageobacillus caldoxylosilyticus]|uniref:Uncharacterized protein n=1 Tax=Saccharococcus caldoxylosilyticus TaxID=81408 RepID=A0A150L732_9BACL|nr:hypothetical protein B4119_3558 [Parageobacillus caldoxylosilyticus]